MVIYFLLRWLYFHLSGTQKKIAFFAIFAFQELLLTDTDDRFPIVFLKDVKFSDLESLIKFIYQGKTEIPAANLTSCSNLAETLGKNYFREIKQISLFT